jgi:hypothetical protein
VTGFGAGDSRGHGGFLYCVVFHLLLGRVYDDKDVQERIVRRSELDWVILRPVILTNEPKSLSRIGRSARLDMRVRISSSNRSTTTPFCIRRRCSRADANAGSGRAAQLQLLRRPNGLSVKSRYLRRKT